MSQNPCTLFVKGDGFTAVDRSEPFALTQSGSPTIATVAGRTGIRVDTNGSDTVSFATAGRAWPKQGAILCRYYRESDTGAFNRLVSLGTNPSTGDSLLLYLDTSDRVAAVGRQGGAGANRLITTSGAVPTGAWRYAYADWDATSIRAKPSGGAMATAARGDTMTAEVFGTGIGWLGVQSTATLQLNGLLAEVMLFERPLTAAELAYMESLSSWSFGSLTDLQDEPPRHASPRYPGTIIGEAP